MATKTSARRKGGARKSTSRTRSAKSGTKSAGVKRGGVKRSSVARGAGSRASTKPPTPERPSKGISRIDQPSRRTHGFFVRLDYQKTPDGYRPRLVSFFGDASHGGKRGAWKAAEAWATRMRRQSKRAGGAAKRGRAVAKRR
jgi:hypothetical protein